MINIEGTPHEKALLVVSSYLIGFVSAYIAFTYAFPQTNPAPVMTYVPISVTQTAAVAESQAAVEMAVDDTQLPDIQTEEITEPIYDLVYENQGLYLYGITAEPMLLSKQITALGVEYTDNMTLSQKQGMHSAVPAYRHFDNSEYVYFCESYDNETECVPYIFNLADNTLHALQTESGPITLDISEASAITLDSLGSLEVGNYVSTNIMEPWLVISL